MKQRQNLVERFFTFIEWDDNRFQTWVADPRLRRSMENYLSQDLSLTSEQYWILFLHKDWLDRRESICARKTSRIPHHLYAYLQEPCYRAAETIDRNYQNRWQYTIEDYFNVGFLNLDDILSKFNPKLNPNLAAHAFSLLKWRILDEMRQLDRTFGHTIWSLLLKCTETRLKKALISHGISQESIKNYLIAWDYYKQFYPQARVVSMSRLQEPNNETWEKINKAYNQEQPNSKCDVAIIKKWLSTCAQSLQKFHSLYTISSNAPFSQGEEGELQDIFLDEKEKEPFYRLEIQEEFEENKAIFQKIYTWLKAELELLNPESQLILKMVYQQNLTQKETGEKLGIIQETVSKKMKKIREKLAKKFIEWSKHNLNISLKTNDIKTMSNIFKVWLEYHYQNTDINQ